MSTQPTPNPTNITDQALERVTHAAADADVVLSREDLHEAAAQLEFLDTASNCVQAWIDRLA